MPDVSVSITRNNNVSLGLSTGVVPSFKRQKFSRTAYSGYTQLTANQFAGTAAITLDFVFKLNSLSLYRNGVIMEYNVEYTEASDRTGFTFDPTIAANFDTTDKFEAKYAK